jgi:pseudouridine-5'-phosphate glycosidase
VVGYQTDTLPAFYSRSSGFPVDYRADTPDEVAAAMQAKWAMNLNGGMLIAVPIPEEHALPSADIDSVIVDAIAEMQRQGISGKDATPYLLGSIVERTGGKSLDANIQLVLNNANVAAAIAVKFASKSL